MDLLRVVMEERRAAAATAAAAAAAVLVLGVAHAAGAAVGVADDVASGVLEVHRERCFRSRSLLDCFKYKGYKFLGDLLEPVVSVNISEVADSPHAEPVLVRLPSSPRRVPAVRDALHRAFGSSDEFLEFAVGAADDFLSRHGFVVTVKTAGPEPDSPWIIAPDDARVARSTRKVKKKEMAVVFPILVLFKFLKIKMLLVPILAGVVFLKKLLILTLTLLPYLVGLFGCCRRPSAFGGLQSSHGVIHELDTRGDVSSSGFAYSFPAREDMSFRQKDKNKQSEFYEY